MKRNTLKTGLLAVLLILTSISCYAAFFPVPEIVYEIRPNMTVYQDHPVRGKVVDGTGKALIGVSVKIEGTGKGAVTNADGEYSLEGVSDNAILIFSYIGFSTQKIPIAGKSVINVVMQENSANLNELVVMGYSTKKLSEVSSSVDVVSGKQLNGGITSNNVLGMLQGKAAGVIVSNASGDPSSTASIVIRGTGSISAGSDPLIVVDGIIGGYADPNDVASVTVLKDAAATGLYGSRASNGVIIITTKTGQSGKTKISLNARVGFSKEAQGNFKVMNSTQLYNYEKTFFPANDFSTLRPASILETSTDWHDLAYRTALNQDYVLSISGGTDMTKFYISGNYYNEQGTLRHTGIKAYNLRTNFSQKINDKITLNVRMNARFQSGDHDPSGNYGAITGSIQNMPFDDPFNKDGSIKVGTEPGWIGREHDNFLNGWEYNFDQTDQKGLDGDIDLTYSIIPGLQFSTYNRISYENDYHEIYYDVRSKAGIGIGSLRENFSFQTNLITSNRLEFNKSFGKHSIDLLGVVEAQKDHIKQNTQLGNGFPPGLHVMNDAAQIIPIPIPKPGTIADNSGIITESVFNKGLLQAQYNYNDKYFFVGSFINEASSRFGSNNRSANFYTLAGSWMLSNENFIKRISIINQLKLRVSYGSTGNANIGDYQSLGLYNYSAQYNGLSASLPFQLANPDLTWEKAKTLNVGMDVGLFKRISVSLDWYNKTTKDLLLNVPLPYTTGFASVTENIGSIRNVGFEIRLNSLNIDNTNFKWTTTFNIAFNKNHVLALYQDKPINISDVNGNTSQQIKIGSDMFTWYMYKWAGVDPQNGDPLWEKIITNSNGTKEITTTNSYNDATLQPVGSASPKFTGGITNILTYRNLTLSAFFNFVYGNLVYNSQMVPADGDGAYIAYNSRTLVKGEKRWMKPGDKATLPKAVYGGNLLSNKPSSRMLENGSYIRLQNVRLSYSLSEVFAKKLKVSDINFYISADNLWTGTDHYIGLDPASTLSNGPGGSVGYIDSYAISKKILFGINFSF